MGTSVLLIGMFVLLALGVPIGVALAMPILMMLVVDPFVPETFIAEVFYSGVANFTMMAMPFFMLADRKSVV